MADSRLLISSQVYDCVRCGKSCGNWRILVEPSALAFLDAHPLTLEARQQGYTPLHVHSDGWGHMGFSEKGKCTYLREGVDKAWLCAIQRDSGFEHKPRACRQFPYLLVETPDGVQIGVSFSCTAVQDDHGRPLESQRQDLENLVASGSYPRAGFEPLRLPGNRTWSWDEYRAWEDSLLGRLRTADAALALEALLWSELAALCGGGPVKERLLALFWASLMGFLESKEGEQMAWVRDRCLAGERYLSPRFQVGVSPAGFDLQWLPGVGLRRYLCQLVERKFLALGSGFTGRLVTLAALPRLLGCYARVLQKALACDDARAFWCVVELLEGELFAGDAGLDGLFLIFEDILERSLAGR